MCKHRSLLTNTTHSCCSEGSSRPDFHFHSSRTDPALGVLTETLNGLEPQTFLAVKPREFPGELCWGCSLRVSEAGGEILRSIIHGSIKIFIFTIFFFKQAIILWKLSLIKSNTILTNALSHSVRTNFFFIIILFIYYFYFLCCSHVHPDQCLAVIVSRETEKLGCNRLEGLLDIYSFFYFGVSAALTPWAEVYGWWVQRSGCCFLLDLKKDERNLKKKISFLCSSSSVSGPTSLPSLSQVNQEGNVCWNPGVPRLDKALLAKGRRVTNKTLFSPAANKTLISIYQGAQMIILGSRH